MRTSIRFILGLLPQARGLANSARAAGARPRRYRQLLVLLLALLAGTGCVSSRAFIPGEHVTALSPRGSYYAAEYAVREASHPIAEAKVWSRGIVREDGRTTVHVSFQVDNVSEEAVRLDVAQLFLDDVKLERGELDRIRPSSLNGEALVPPGQEREIDVEFTLPESIEPDDVINYRVVWGLRNGGVYSQKTPFLRAARRRHDPAFSLYYNYYGYYPGYSYWPYTYRAWPSYRYRRYYPNPGWRYRRFR